MPEIKKRTSFLSFAPPLLGEEEIAEVVDTLRSGWLTTGPKTKQFEKDFCDFLGAPAALALNSATSGMHLALVASGVGQGDIVLASPITFCSGIHVIEHVGARPVLVDVEPDTLNLSPQKIEEALSSKELKGKIKAIIATHFAGHPCEMDAILDIAKKYNLCVIEDAAHGLPAKYKNQSIGSTNRFTAFSFYVSKNMTTGEGGMLTGEKEALEKARTLSLHGMSRDSWKRYSDHGSWYYEVTDLGFKYNMMDLQAAIGIHQLKKLPEFQKRRYEIAAVYQEAFSGIDALQIPTSKSEVDHAWHLYVLRLNSERLKISRNQFIEELKARNIGTSVHFIPIHLHPFYRDKYGWKPEDFPVAYKEYQRSFSLPIYPKMTEADVSDVIHAVIDVVEGNKK